jgi:hypothetical protein
VLRGARLVIGSQDAEGVIVPVHLADVVLGEGTDLLAALVRALDDLVVDVRDVADESDMQAAIREVAAHHIEHQLRARVSHVAQVVDGIAAHVHADAPGLDGLERLLAAAE